VVRVTGSRCTQRCLLQRGWLFLSGHMPGKCVLSAGSVQARHMNTACSCGTRVLRILRGGDGSMCGLHSGAGLGVAVDLAVRTLLRREPRRPSRSNIGYRRRRRVLRCDMRRRRPIARDVPQMARRLDLAPGTLHFRQHGAFDGTVFPMGWRWALCLVGPVCGVRWLSW
jgi:hypothetical protein